MIKNAIEIQDMDLMLIYCNINHLAPSLLKVHKIPALSFIGCEGGVWYKMQYENKMWAVIPQYKTPSPEFIKGS